MADVFPIWTLPRPEGNDMTLTITINIASIVGCVFMLITYRSLKGMQYHPFSMINWMALVLLLQYACLLTYFLLPEQDNILLMLTWVGALLFSTAFKVWMYPLAITLLTVTKKPFYDPSKAHKYYGFVWVPYLVIVIILMFIIMLNTQNVNEVILLNFYLTLVAPLALSLVGCIYALTRIRALNNIYSKRRNAVIQLVLYSLIFILGNIGSIALAVYLIKLEKGEMIDIEGIDMLYTLHLAENIGQGLQGVLFFLVWATTPNLLLAIKSICCRGNFYMDSGDDVKNMNALLRKNIIYCFLEGFRNHYKNDNDEVSVFGEGYSMLDVVPSDCVDKISNSLVNIADIPLIDDFKFTILAPKIFHNLILKSGYFIDSLCESLDPEEFFETDIEERISVDRNEIFSVFTPDRKYLIAAVAQDEYHTMLDMLPEYYHHMSKYPNSLLMRVLGLFKLKVMDTTIYFIISDTVIEEDRVKYIYELRGNYVIRRRSSPNNQKTVMSDFQFMDHNHRIDIPIRTDFLKQLEADSNFLSRVHVYNYCLKVAIDELDFFNEITPRTKGINVLISTTQERIYYMGIIDILYRRSPSTVFSNFKKGLSRCNSGYISSESCCVVLGIDRGYITRVTSRQAFLEI
eukprot:TRINITY_DN2650_c0_g1_i1.p2 TRINITY_DN2650_c0_g1~~TRINITY_DN2650_c0_g1_i1.p2  ORF type:complete len:630 (-),score=87.45 TRINITY_DN2650_c0_g1_i1:1886-3775(-)